MTEHFIQVSYKLQLLSKLKIVSNINETKVIEQIMWHYLKYQCIGSNRLEIPLFYICPLFTLPFKLIWSNLFNQINSIMYTAKFDTFLFHQISFIQFWKIGSVLFHQTNLIKESIKIEIPTREEKTTKIKLQINEHEACFRVNNIARLQLLQAEFTT